MRENWGTSLLTNFFPEDGERGGRQKGGWRLRPKGRRSGALSSSVFEGKRKDYHPMSKSTQIWIMAKKKDGGSNDGEKPKIYRWKLHENTGHGEKKDGGRRYRACLPGGQGIIGTALRGSTI